MRVLVLAYDCHPTLPSLPVVAYKACASLAEKVDVTVVTRKQADDFQVPGAETIFIDNDRLKGPLDKLGNLIRGDVSVGWTTKIAFNYPSYIDFEYCVWKALKDQIQAGRFDVIHRITPMTPTLPSPLAKWVNTPFVIGPLNGGLQWPEEFSHVRNEEREWLTYLRQWHKYLPYYMATYNSSSAILTGFHHTAEDIPQICREKVINFPEVGLDPTIFKPKDVCNIERPINFLFVGRLVPYKCPDLIVNAFANSPLLKEQKLTIVGDGPLMRTIKKMIMDNNLQTTCQLVGSKTQHQVAEHMRSNDVFVFPSVRELGAGVILEAMGSGLPCLVVDYGAPGHLVDETRGWKVPLTLKDKMTEHLQHVMEEIVLNPKQIETFSRRSIDYSYDYQWEKKSDYLCGIYNWVLDTSKDKPLFYS